MSVLDYDNSLRFLADCHLQQKSVPKEKLVGEFGKLRNNFSLQWLLKFKNNDCERSLAVVLNVIFRYAAYPESNVSISAYSALGGLLMTVSPYVPRQFINAFATAISPLPISPKISIAIINSFVYLTRFVSPVRMTDFLSRVQVLTHFSVDMTENLKYLPQIIPLMKNLPIQFHQNVIRSLVYKCGRQPNSSFVSCAMALIESNPQQLLSLTIQFLDENKLFLAADLLGASLLKNKSYYDMLNEQEKKLFFDAAILALTKEHLELSSFESGCVILSLFLKYNRNNTELYNSYDEEIQKAINRDMLPVYKVRLFLLPRKLEELKDDPKDTDQMKSAKLQALAQFYIDNEDNVDVCNPDVISEMFLKYKNSENDLYCVLIESFALCIRSFIIKCKKRFHLQLLEFILRKKNKNWVHDEAVAKLIDHLDSYIVPKYTDLILQKLCELSLSNYDRLCDTSIQSFVRFSSYSNLDSILQKIMWSDWLDEKTCERRFRLLSKLAKCFSSPLFKQFIPIAYEVLELCDDTKVTSYAFLFLSRIQIDYLPVHVRDYTFKYIVKYYQQYSHKTIEGPIRKYIDSTIDQPFLDGVDSDIVSNPILSHKKGLKHVMNAYKFLSSIDIKLLEDVEALFWISLALVPVFDKFALDEATTLYQIRPVNFAALWDLNNETFLTTSQDDVAASCLSLIIRSGMAPIPAVNDLCTKFLTDNITTNTDLLFYSFVIIDQTDHEKTMEAVDLILKRLSIVDKISFLYKILHLSVNYVMKIVDDRTSFALLEFSNEQNGMYDEKIEKYFEIAPFNEWNVIERPLLRNLIVYLERTKKKRVLKNPEEFDHIHWQFIIDHKECFELDECVRPYIKDHPNLFSKLNVSLLFDDNYLADTVIRPTLKPIDISKSIQLSTAAPMFYDKKVVKDVPLIRSFFENSNTKIDNNVFMKCFEYCEASFDIYAMNSVLDFAQRTGQEVDISVIQKHMIVLTDRVFPHFIKCFKHVNGFINSLQPEIKEKIERKLQCSIEPNLLLKYAQNKNIKSLIETDTKYFIQYFDNEPQYKAKQLIPLIHLQYKHLLPFDIVYKL